VAGKRVTFLFTTLWGMVLRWRAVRKVAICAMEIGYPVAIAAELATGMFFSLAAFHLGVLAVLGVWYWLDMRDLPARNDARCPSPKLWE